MTTLAQGHLWMDKQFNPLRRITNLALHECIAMGDQCGIIRALHEGACLTDIVCLGEERTGFNAIERSVRTGDIDLIKLIRCQLEAE